MDLRAAVLSLAVGCAVGVAYGLIDVRSPAPPVIALLGLLGMVLGEQAVIAAKARLHRTEPPRMERPADPR